MKQAQEKTRRGVREELPVRRPALVQKVKLLNWSIFVCVGFYADGRPAEIFVDMPKAGSTVRAQADALARIASLALQYGVPIEEITHMLKGVKFEPSTEKYTSFIDVIGQVLEELAQAGPGRAQAGPAPL